MVGILDSGERVAVPRPGAEAFRALAEAVDRCVFVKDTASRYVLVNSAFRRWLGRDERDVVGRSVFDVWPPAVAQALAADDRRVLTGERVAREEQRPNTRELRTLKTLKMPIRDARGRVAGILGCFADVTGKRHHREDARAAQHLAVVGRLTAGLAYDLNHLLTQARVNVSALASGVPVDAPQRVVAERAETDISRAAELTQRLMTFAREDDSVPEPADLNAAVCEVATLFRAVLDQRITLELFPGAGLPRVRAPLSQLTQIVLNLCVTARDAMPAGGRLALETDLVHVTAHTAAALPRGPRLGLRTPHVRLRVTDTGGGVDPEVRTRVIEPCFRAAANGQSAGLGLAVVQDVARRHGGWVECAGAASFGTCFDVFLPCADAETGAEPAARLTAPSAASILLADNDDSIVTLCRTILESRGYRVLEAGDGHEAVTVYRRQQGRIGLVLLDQNMPGMSGLDVLAELTATDPGVRVVFMSGAPLDDVPAAFNGNLRGFLSKPFNSHQLLDAVRSALA